jgi:hypothetical protein
VSTSRRELLGEWAAPDPKYLLAVALWRKYDRLTDEFDLAHGASRNARGEVGPARPGWRAASARFAKVAYAELRNAAAVYGVDDATLEAAKRSRERWAPAPPSPSQERR